MSHVRTCTAFWISRSDRDYGSCRAGQALKRLRGCAWRRPEKTLVEVFKELDERFHFVENKVRGTTKLQQLRQILKDSLAAHLAGDEMKGVHLLHDFEDIVWPKRFEEDEKRKGSAVS